MRFRPRPVSMLFAGSGSSTELVASAPGSCSNCMNTRFQYSRKRSFSPPGRSSGEPWARPRSMYSSEHGPHGPAGPACQKFSERGHSTIRSRSTPSSRQQAIASSSGPSPSASSPSNTVTQMSSAGEAEHLAGELPCELDRLALEVVAEGEVAEHLKERQMPRRVADVVDVNRAEDLLAARQAPRRRSLLAEEVGLQGVHPRHREQRRGVVRGGHERCRGNALVPALLEEAQIALADLIRCHGASHLRVRVHPAGRARSRSCHGRRRRRPRTCTRADPAPCARRVRRAAPVRARGARP